MTEADLPGPVTAKNAALLEMCLREAALAGKPLMERLVSSAQQVAGRPSVDATRRERLSHSMGLLRSLAVGLGERFPAHLNRAFSAKSKPVPAAAGLASLRFDQLELMNESQVEEKMELARALSSISTEVDPKQKQLNALMSTVQGYKSIQPERNPLRPESYLDALVELFKQSEVGPDVRVDWLQCMGPDLGRALNDEYTRWITVLKTGGVKGASYALASGSAREGAAAGASGGQSRHSEGLDPTPYADARLTVKQLRRLVMGEFDMRRDGDEGNPSMVPASGDRRKRGKAFENTIPAALETLEEMHQVEDAMQRLARRSGTVGAPAVQPHRRSEPQPEPEVDEGSDPSELARRATP